MTAHVICLTSSGGIPLFKRRKEGRELMTFSKMACLNGVHMFLKTQNIDLLNTDMSDTTIVWKVFKDCITLIAIASGTTKRILNKFLDFVFNAMVLKVGLKDIEQPKSIERLKRDLRACYPIIDKLLEYLDISDKTGTNIDFIDLTDCIISSENHLLQICLDGYMECLDSLYGCLLIHDCLAVATESWWSLDPIERKLLILAITSESNSNMKDAPVFLPHKSPNLAYRLVNITLVNNVQVLALCGPNPELNEIERLAIQCWRNSIELLRTSEQFLPQNFPITVSLDSEILGFLLVNYKIKKFVLSRNTQHTKNHFLKVHRLDTIRTFYDYAVETFLVPSNYNDVDDNEKTNADVGRFKQAKETYWCSEYHKCHALKEADNIFCVFYTSIVPTHTMRVITQKTLKILLTDKQICW